MFLNHACNVLKQQGEGVGKHNISLTIYIQETETYSKPIVRRKISLYAENPGFALKKPSIVRT